MSSLNIWDSIMNIESTQTLLIEAIAVGILMIPLGFIVFIGSAELSKRSRWYDGLNRDIKMCIGFFIYGAITHLLCEISGINKWYCKHGRACR